MANKIQKQKGVLVGIGIAILVIAIAALVGGIIMLCNIGTQEAGSVGFVLFIVFGSLLTVLGVIGLVAGVRTTWVACALKATKGTVTEKNLALDHTHSMTKTCPKCGCSNTQESKVCSNCGTELE